MDKIKDITLTKSKQVAGFNKESEVMPDTQEMDRVMKIIVAALEIAFECPDAINEKLELQDDHIKNKSIHGHIRYKPSNHQLIKYDKHSAKGGKYIDYRHPSEIEYMKQFDCLFINGRSDKWEYG